MESLPIDLIKLLFVSFPMKRILELTSVCKSLHDKIKLIYWDMLPLHIRHIGTITVLNRFHIMKVVVLNIPLITEDFVKHLNKCTSVEINNCSIVSGNVLSHLAHCKHVKLSMVHGIINDDLRHLARCESVAISQTDITDDGIKNLSGCKKIVLFLCYGISDRCFQYLGNCHTLKMYGCGLVTDAGLKYLSGCTTVKLLGRNNTVTDDGLVHLSKCDSVKLVSYNKITDSGLRHLSNCRTVKLSGCSKITVFGLLCLARCVTVCISNCFHITKKNIQAYLKELGHGQCPNDITKTNLSLLMNKRTEYVIIGNMTLYFYY